MKSRLILYFKDDLIESIWIECNEYNYTKKMRKYRKSEKILDVEFNG